MNTKFTNNSRLIWRVLGAFAIAALALATGCVVTSVYPYYTQNDVVFELALLGDWVEAGKTNAPSECVRFEQAGADGYRATTFTSEETNTIVVVLFRLKDQLFLDVCTTNHSLDYVPAHQLSKVTMTGATLETASLNYDWLTKLLERDPGAIRHIRLREDAEEDRNRRIVLTADTKELQRFVLSHLNKTNAWSETTHWQRPGQTKQGP
jgi:hypothetical protein